MYKSDKRIYLDKDGKVTADEAKAYSLLVGEGVEIDDETAERYGLTKPKRKAEKPEDVDTKEIDHAPETKDVKGPAASKAKGRK